MAEHFEKVAAYVMGDDKSEIGFVKAERDYALHCLERELAISAMSMTWERAETASIDENAYYIVQDNGHEWRDFDLSVQRGVMVLHKLKPSYVRGRPEWIAKIVRPVAVGNSQVRDNG